MTTENKPQDLQRDKSSRDMELEIRDTRASLNEDIKALSDKVTPANLKQEAKHEVKQAAKHVKTAAMDKAVEVKDTAKGAAVEFKDAAVDKAVAAKEATVDTAHQLTDKASETMEQVGAQTRRAGSALRSFIAANPMPLGLIGIGAGWLITNHRRGRAELRSMPPPIVERTVYADEYGYSSGAVYPAEASAFGVESMQTSQPLTERERPIRSRMEGAKHNIGEAAHNLSGKASAAFDRAQHKLADSAAHGRDVVQRNYGRARQASHDIAQDYPLAVALGTLMTGLGLGLLLPSTTREDKLLGPSRERFRQNLREVRSAAQEVGRTAKQTATDTMATVEGPVH